MGGSKAEIANFETLYLNLQDSHKEKDGEMIRVKELNTSLNDKLEEKKLEEDKLKASYLNLQHKLSHKESEIVRMNEHLSGKEGDSATYRKQIFSMESKMQQMNNEKEGLMKKFDTLNSKNSDYDQQINELKRD